MSGRNSGPNLPGVREGLAILVLLCLAPSALNQMLMVLDPFAIWIFGICIAAVMMKYLFFKFRQW